MKNSIIGESDEMKKVFSAVEQIAPLEVTVLITGESGTGKDLVAQNIHKLSGRREGPFVAVNTGAIAPELISSELFGHEKGSFTGAMNRKKGKFEIAEEGTLFLDEVSTMSTNTQISLLRVLESREFQRVGGERFLRTNVRLIAATNENLQAAIKDKKFRADLFHRLNVFSISLPPLRKRGDDILLLANHFLKQYCDEFNKKFLPLTEEVENILLNYPWPGNVRELQNTMIRLAVTATKDKIGKEDLPDLIVNNSTDSSILLIEVGSPIEAVERKLIEATLKKVNGKKNEAADILGISRKALYNKIQAYSSKEK
ncbi:MAG: sigma-54 interaction domain-containing protein [Spirochaetia bacterium]